MLHLSRLAEDWILYSSEEFGWIEMGDGVTSGSSLMPQKKNPDSLELIRGKCGRVVGCLNAMLVTMKGLPLTYNRDMQEDKEPLFDATDQLSGSLEMARVVVDSVKLNPAVPKKAAEESWVVATDLAEELSRAGVPFHRAHQIVGQLVLESIKRGKRPAFFRWRRPSRRSPTKPSGCWPAGRGTSTTGRSASSNTSTISRDARPRTSATKPMPHASRSAVGSKSVARGGTENTFLVVVGSASLFQLAGGGGERDAG